MNFAVNNVWAFLAVGVLVAGHITITFISAVNSKKALREATGANKAVNGNPVGEPRAYDLLLSASSALEDLRGEILDVASSVDRVNQKLDEHLSWHQQQAQSPRSVPPSSGRTRKAVAKKPVKKVAAKK